MCPFCLCLPVMSVLRKISNHLELVKARHEEQGKEETAAKFSKALQIAELVGLGWLRVFVFLLKEVAGCPPPSSTRLWQQRRWRGSLQAQPGPTAQLELLPPTASSPPRFAPHCLRPHPAAPPLLCLHVCPISAYLPSPLHAGHW
jgi:hypothetical protein